MLRASTATYEKENRDLEEIIRREKNIADIFSEVVKIKTNEISDYKNSIEILSVSDKSYLTSTATGKAIDSICEYCSSVINTPYNKNTPYDLSFNSRDKFNQIGSIQETIENSEKALINIWTFTHQAIDNKIKQFSLLKNKFDDVSIKLKEKIQLLQAKIIKKDSDIENFKEIIVKNEDSRKNNQEKLIHCNQEILKLKEIIKKNDSEIDTFYEKLNVKEKESISAKEIIQKNEDDKRILNEKISGLKKEIERLKKNTVDLEQNKITSLKNENNIKELKDKYKIAQIRLSELELVHREAEQEISLLIEQVRIAKEETRLFKEEAKYFEDDAKTFKEKAQLLEDDAKISKEKAQFFENDAKMSKEKAQFFENDARVLKEKAESFKDDARASKEKAENDSRIFNEKAEMFEYNLRVTEEEIQLYKNEINTLKESLNDALKPPSTNISISTTTDNSFQFIHFDLVYENMICVDPIEKISIPIDEFQSIPPQPETIPSTELSLLFDLLSEKIQKQVTLETIIEIEEKYSQEKILQNQIKEISEKNNLLEAVYKKLTEDVKIFQDTYKEKMEDLKLDKYELIKELEDHKKKISLSLEENRKGKEELLASEAGKKELHICKADYENKIAKIIMDCDEKAKKIAELNQEVLNSSNYVEKILKEKENIERELSSLSKSVRNI